MPHAGSSKPWYLSNLPIHATSHSPTFSYPPSQTHRTPIAHPSYHQMPTTTCSNVPTTHSGLQRGDPPQSKRKRSNADGQAKKRTKSEKDDDKGVEKKRK